MMKKLLFGLSLFIITSAFSQIPPTDTLETRALWVSRWDYNTERSIEIIIENAASLHFNVLFFQVRGNGTVAYPSEYEPWAREYGNTHPGWDPLQKAIETAHQFGVQLHAWVNVYPGWRGSDQPYNLNQAHDWFMVDYCGELPSQINPYQWLSPTINKAQIHILDVLTEIYRNYDIDGLHLDYFRYPGTAYSYDTLSVNSFHKEFGASPEEKPLQWSNHRRAAVTGLLQELYSQIKTEKPQVVLSASVIGDYYIGRNVFFQDSHEWLAKGIIDAICPMIYVSDDTLFRKRLLDHRENDHGRHIIPGLHLGMNPNPANQIAIAKELGCPGIALFSYRYLFPDHEPNDNLSAILRDLWPDSMEPKSMAWKSNFYDAQGPAIMEIYTYPQTVLAGQPFSILAKITDPSGVYDDDTGSNGQGIYLVYERTQHPKVAGEVTMHALKNSENWYITDKKITIATASLDFHIRIFAHDDFHESISRPKRNLGYSDSRPTPVLHPEELFTCAGVFGPSLWRPNSIAVDARGKVWISEIDENRVRVILPNGTEASFSPITHGLSPERDSIRIGIPSGLCLAMGTTMCLVSNSESSYILRYNIDTGRPLAGIQLSFVAGELDCNNNGYFFVLQNSTNRWRVLNADGIELGGSPFGGGDTAWGIAVDPKVATVYVTNETHDIVERWVGAIEAGRARFWREDFPVNNIGLGKIKSDNNGNFYFPHTPLGLVTIWNGAGQPLGHISGGNPPINAPKSIGVSPDGKTVYILETSGFGPTRLVKWERSLPK